MSVNGSVVSNDSIDVKEMMAVLDAPVAPTKKGKRTLKTKPTTFTPLAIVPVSETLDADETEETLPTLHSIPTPLEVEEINYKELYEALKVKYDELVSKSVKAKNENSPPEEGIHMRMVGGVKTKTKYIFPYAADGGKSIVKEMKDGQKCIGVSTTQKNNSKTQCKVADYDLIWVNAKIVKDTKTGKAYPHKDGKFAVMNEEDMTSFNVRMMIVAE